MKKLISLILALAMMMSASVYAADYFIGKDAEGNIIGCYSSVDTMWDIDFEDGYTLQSTTGNLKKDGADYKPNGNLFKSYTGDTSVTGLSDGSFITNNPDSNRFLSLDASPADTAASGDKDARINEIQLGTDASGVDSAGVLVSEFDFALNEAPTEQVNVVWRPGFRYYDGSKNSSNYETTARLNIEKNTTKLHVASDTTKKFELDVNKWYHITQTINFDNKEIKFYIDGTLFNTTNYKNSSFDYNGVLKMTATTNSTNSNILYYDNIKIYKATTDLGLTLENITPADVSNVEGSPAQLKATCTNPDISIKIKKSTDGINYTDYADSANAVAYYEGYTTYYKAVACTQSGIEFAESEPVSLATKYVKANGTEYWDLDFESHVIYQNVLRKTGESENYSPVPGNIFTFYTENKGSVSIGATSGISGADNGNSAILDASGMTADSNDGQARLNEIQLKAQCTVLVTEFDFAFNELPKSSDSIVMRPSMNTTVSGSGSYKFPIYLTRNGKITLNNDGTKAKDVQPNKWYSIMQIINLTDKKVDLYVDGELVNSVEYTENYVEVLKLNASTHQYDGAKNGNILYYDNFNIYSVAQSSAPALKIGSVEYKINGTKVDKIAAGKLTADVILLNNNSANADLVCYGAVYDNGELTKLVINDNISFTSSEAGKLIKVDFGEVKASDTVKILFWNKETLVPNGANDTLNVK